MVTDNGKWALLAVLVTVASFLPLGAQTDAHTPALPDLSSQVGDPRLQALPDFPLRLVNVPTLGTDVSGNPVTLFMRFPPRVNGQNQSDGDKHADMWVLFDAKSGRRIDQPPVIEAAPMPLTRNELTARKFSAIWELHALLVDPSYDPRVCSAPLGDPVRQACIDSAAKVVASPFVVKDLQTNIFLNCPIVPAGTVVDPVPGGPVPNEPRVMQAFFEGGIVNFVPYDIEDGGFNPQILYAFKDASGNFLNAAGDPVSNASPIPHLLASKAPGEPFYSSIWELWAVTVTKAQLATIKSAADVTKAGIPQFPIRSTGIRLNCPVVAINGTPFPFEDAFALLERLLNNGSVNDFEPDKRVIVGIPAGSFTPSRSFTITEVTLGPASPGFVAPPADAAPSMSASKFPIIDPDDKGNVIPLIFKNPFQVDSSGPSTTPGSQGRVRFSQDDLDGALATSGQLPPQLEANFDVLIKSGLLDPVWGPTGGKPYQDRLALVGRALFEMVWNPEEGGNQKDVTSCLACHSQPHSGGAARGLYNLRRNSDRGGDVNAGSMWGGGGAELLRSQLIATGMATSCTPPALPITSTGPAGCIVFAHGSTGGIANLRAVVAGAFNTHVGVQSTEFILDQASAPTKCGFNSSDSLAVRLAVARNCDFDNDGKVEEMTVGEVTAVTAFLASLPVPRQADEDVIINRLGLDPVDVAIGRTLFRTSIDNGGAQCASCHVPFRPFPLGTMVLDIPNRETGTGLPIRVDHHTADSDDVNEGLATTIGQPGLRLWGDFKLHKMGALMRNGQPSRDIMKTAELWDVGSVFPWGRDGRWTGAQLLDVILAHRGVSLNAIVQLGDATTNIVNGSLLTSRSVSICGIPAGAPLPIHVVLTGQMTPGLTAANASLPGPGGGFRQGAQWLVSSVPTNGCVSLTLRFNNPNGVSSPKFGLTIQDDTGFSEAVASVQAFKALGGNGQGQVMDFLRAQLIGGKIGEGSGLVPPPDTP